MVFILISPSCYRGNIITVPCGDNGTVAPPGREGGREGGGTPTFRDRERERQRERGRGRDEEAVLRGIRE